MSTCARLTGRSGDSSTAGRRLHASTTFALYLGYFFPMSHGATISVAITSIALLTAINCFGIKLGALAQNGFTLLKIVSLMLLVLLCFALTGGATSNFSPVLPTEPFSKLAGPLLLSMVAALFAFDGWIEITYVAGEVKNPNRTIPRSLFLSTLIATGLYVAVNAGLIYVLPLSSIAGSQMVASDAAVKIMGSAGAAVVAVAVIISTFGANNGYIFTCPRIYYAMAKEGLFFRWLSRIHPQYKTPVPSLIIQGVIASILVYSGTFDQLATYVVFPSWFFYLMSVGAVFLLRSRSPQAARPYKAWGYPYTPLLFILFSIYLLFDTVVEIPRDSLIGAGIVLLGVPAYFFWKLKGAHRGSRGANI
ncbi:MAG: amino acid permease [Ignavibacteria bacterium]|nr:MAG: amino acid permease [Ignavibacteria bacterium]